jgi:hypothetical protein
MTIVSNRYTYGLLWLEQHSKIEGKKTQGLMSNPLNLMASKLVAL